MMTMRETILKCRECGKPVTVTIGDDEANPCPIDMLDTFAKWVTCMACLIKLGRVKVHAPVQPPLPVAPAPEPRSGEVRPVRDVGLPYVD